MSSIKKVKPHGSTKAKIGQTPKKKATTEVIVAQWKKNDDEVVRVMLQVYGGENVVSIRTWYRDPHRQLKAGRRGINLNVDLHLKKLAKAVNKANRIAKEFPPVAS